jgi:hypothetical protein
MVALKTSSSHLDLVASMIELAFRKEDRFEIAGLAAFCGLITHIFSVSRI